MPQFHWSDEAIEAAELLAAGRLNRRQIAEQVCVVPKTLYNWSQDREFDAKVCELREERRAEIRRIGLAEVENRVAELQADLNALEEIRKARAADPKLAKLPGGKTGLVILGAGNRPVIDLKILKEKRAILRQAAAELGQWGTREEGSEVDIAQAVAKTRAAAAAYTDPTDDEPTDQPEDLDETTEAETTD